MSERPYVGGQAVIEGVMMRGPNSLAVAVRRADGEIVLRESPWRSIWEKLRFLRWPFLRGAVVLVESMVNGIGALNFSAEQASLDDPEAQSTEAGEPVEPAEPEPALSKWAIYGTVAVALGFAIFLFKVLPHLLALGVGWISGTDLNVDSVWFHALDGGIKVGIFLLYVFLIGLVPDIKRVFMYHGSEHMTIHCYEAERELTVENVREYPTLHPRCGTTFLVVVILFSIVVFSLAFIWLPRLAENAVLNQILLIGLKLPLLFPIMGLAYEYQRFTARRCDQGWVKVLAAPGLAVQRLTTRQPTDDQLEVAIASMRQALWREQAGPEASSPAGDDDLIRIQDYREVGVG